MRDKKCLSEIKKKKKKNCNAVAQIQAETQIVS